MIANRTMMRVSAAILLLTLILQGSDAFQAAPLSKSATKCKLAFGLPSACRAAPTTSLNAAPPSQQQEVVLSAEEDAALVARLAKEVEEANGVELDQLLNPGKVVNLERDLLKLSKELEICQDSTRIEEINKEMEQKTKKLNVEKRMVVQGWLKNLFVGQAVISTFAAGLMVYDAVPFVDHLDLSVRVLGFWVIWLFTVPSLRARKPAADEKTALNIAFGATPLTNLALPFFTKDPVTIYWANMAVLGLSYAYGFTLGSNKNKAEAEEEEEESNLPDFLKAAIRALDYGSGRERGLRK
uniref:Uncharacterized protein n=1 Tax=Fibrocapsa japonica TaxID=94617 RepID=A0A7S2UZ01_9STRA|mmetsp:Transcript_20876/g.30221  ORF Transcript_20876/g.30221 Transcript_20876/m.30221 type:complete len:298 (+) Transcript_20876:40-933(+)